MERTLVSLAMTADRDWLRRLRFDIHGVPTYRQGSDWTAFVADVAGQMDQRNVKNPANSWRWKLKLGKAANEPHAVLNALVPMVLDLVVDAVRSQYGETAIPKLSHLRPVTLISDEPLARTTFSKDGPVLLVSGAFVSTLGLFKELCEACSPRTAAAEVGASVAVIRFLTIQQVCFGLNAVHGRRKAQPVNALPELFFSVAHEVAHILLDHQATAGRARQQEHEADLFAYELLVSQPVLRRGAGRATVLALLAATFAGSSGFVRTPTTHPTFDERLAILASGHPSVRDAADRMRGEVKLIQMGMDLRNLMADSVWHDLARSRMWDVSIRSQNAYDSSRVLAQVLASERQNLVDVLRGGLDSAALTSFAPILADPALTPRESMGKLASLGLDIDSSWLDEDTAVHAGDLVAAFTEDVGWAGEQSVRERVTVATVAAAIVASFIRSEDEQRS